MSGQSQFALLKQRRFLPYFTVQALGAFNDNVYRQSIIALLLFLGVSMSERTLYANLAPALFILPYFLFSAIAGQIAEKVEKQKLIVITTTMEIVIMSIAAAGFLLESMPVLLVALFLTGTQSTLFGPVKYSILPSVLRPEELTGGNGLVEMGTSIAILAGMIYGGLVFKIAGSYGPEAAALSVVALAVAGNVVARMIPKVDAGAPELKVNWNPIPESRAIMRLAKRQLAVRNAILGVSWFWFVGTVLTAQLPTYAELHLGGVANDTALYIFALALFSVGVGVGSLLCEKLSGRSVEIGLVPVGAFGITAFLLDLYFARPGAPPSTGLTIAQFLGDWAGWRIVIDLTGIGMFTGFFVVPLFALIQSRTPKSELSRVIAGLNIQNSLFIVTAAILGVLLQMDGFNIGGVRIPLPGLSIPQVFLALAIANGLVALWIFTIVPEFLMRFVSMLLVRVLYRLRLRDIESSVPADGPALIVCNHVSYMDALILSAAIPRPVRFVMYYRIFKVPGMHWIFRHAKAIPIAGAKEDPELMQRAFDAVDAALAEGELVGIFPEGKLTRDGEIAAFKSGVERILERAAARGQRVPVVPMALRGMWSSMWSHRDSRMGRMRVPRRARAHVDVVAGPRIEDAALIDAGTLEAQVRMLRGDAA
ncbi:MFS transporter [Luteimonas terrae]|uniref:1-acyl-sn-glycerol-3-phosphate acyltransferase n=1 Tax=Luteimonas terrae TaxID=1530191 RepID=A0ABU1Y1J5_9GAMM|nr:MFS transporter [Luteimonas terrae]MDR7194241.1 1-acyl-sn-glycerol-3-phosphate acyltransferase [Luteimonas terrae]